MEVEEVNNQMSSLSRDRRPDGLGDLRVLPDEILCAMLFYLTPRDVARLSCVSSVMYILCNEEPLWMSLCLNNAECPFQFKGSWKSTALYQLHLPNKYEGLSRKKLHFEGFSSLYLYRRLYRCYTTLAGFSFDNYNVERKKDISLEEFNQEYDGKKPVVISGLADSWPARHTWTTDQLLLKYGDTEFKISQRSSRKITMKLSDYILYMQTQHDEDPLYVFDDKFGEVAPGLLKDYNVPRLFPEDFFDVLDRDKRPPFRWLIIGPERSGASWHVDPALTSAWNTLLCGRKRWALYPPGRVPSGVTVHVNDEDGDVNIETPSSLQWWLDFYPLLSEEEKPIECTQLPGETIYVPSGWWHCVLNLETTIAVTQNFVNSNNFEFVCLEMAPGYEHKGVSRAGLLALEDGGLDAQRNTLNTKDSLSYSDLSRKEKRIRPCEHVEDCDRKTTANGTCKHKFSYDVNFLSMFLDKERDHYCSLWSSCNGMGPRDLREWLWKLWVGKPGMRDLIWKGACLSLNAEKWYQCMETLCGFHDFPLPKDHERLPVGMGSNPVFLVAENVIKIYVEDGLEASLHSLGTELEFYNLLHEVGAAIRNHIPSVLASGIIFLENGSYAIVPWDGKGVPDVISKSNLIPEKCKTVDFPFGIWSKMQFEHRKAGMSMDELVSSSTSSRIWPYIVTKRCKGKTYAELRDILSWEETLNLASFLGEQLHNLHLVPCPSLDDLMHWDNKQQMKSLCGNNSVEAETDKINFPVEWEFFVQNLNRKKKDVCSRLSKWGDPIPSTLIKKVDEYIPNDLAEIFNIFEDDSGRKSYSWIHSDIMDDNIHMELQMVSSTGNTSVTSLVDNDHMCCFNGHSKGKSWCPCHILDFSDLSVGDSLYDIIPIHIDVFRGDHRLLKQLLENYKLPLARRIQRKDSIKGDSKVVRLSYVAMCYCILHEENILGAIFSLSEDLRTAKSWEEVEHAVWGALNDYTGLLSY